MSVHRWLAIMAALALALGGAAACGEEDSGGGGDAPKADEPASADTGRMSEGEWESAKSAVFDLNGEISDYRRKVADRCAVIISGFEVKNALDCIGEAFDGVEGQASVSVGILEDLKGDTLKQCRRSVTRAAGILNIPLFRALQASKRALDSLDGGAIEASIGNLNRQFGRWDDASGDMLQNCAPE